MCLCYSTVDAYNRDRHSRVAGERVERTPQTAPCGAVASKEDRQNSQTLIGAQIRSHQRSQPGKVLPFGKL